MRTTPDFSPLLRSSIGFDRVRDLYGIRNVGAPATADRQRIEGQKKRAA